MYVNIYFFLIIVNLLFIYCFFTLNFNYFLGNCQIRNSSFVNHQPFATPPKKFTGDGPRRCQGCWLHLCVKSFKMPIELSKRLASYLPTEILQKYPISSLVCDVFISIFMHNKILATYSKRNIIC